MCGFIGIASIGKVADRVFLASGRDALKHRGPDDAGEWWSPDGRVGLAHQRLSIIDLSPAGHQPMSDTDGSLHIVFNGEIYNFIELRAELAALGASFCSQSDTEVLLAAYRAWGRECITRLNGMFSFAIYDSDRQCVLLARDRAGEKPLFYHHSGGTLRFASELKGLLADITLTRRINPEALDCYLAMGYVPGDQCVLQGFSKLPPAHAMQFDLRTGMVYPWRYWQLPDYATDACLDAEDETGLLDELESLLETSVQRQLIADVPVGILLSGGVDSSLITAMAVRNSSKIKTFTIRFPGHARFDETEHARLIARYFGTEHVELEAQPCTAGLLPHLARQFDEPLVDSSMIPTFLVSQLVREHCTVALGGDGGDELFGGYSHYSRLLWMQKHIGLIPRGLRAMLSQALGRLLPVGMKGRNYLQGMGTDFNNNLPLLASYFDKNTRSMLLPQYKGGNFEAENILQSRTPACSDLLQRATRMDFADYLAEDILVKVDRASMLNSLEMRAPLLDYHLIEFAFAKVPACLKATSRSKKILLKRLAGRVLPPEFDQQRKQGFSIPLAEWLKGGEFRELFNDVLLSSQCIFDRSTVQRILHGQDQGHNNGERLFALVLFELWRQEYAVEL